MSELIGEPTVRTKIIAAIMGMVKPPALKRKVSIEELERIINSESEGSVYLNTDGTVQDAQPATTTAGDVADAILAILPDRYAEGVAAATKAIQEQIDNQRNIVSSIKDRHEKQIEAARIVGMGDAIIAIRTLAPQPENVSSKRSGE